MISFIFDEDEEGDQGDQADLMNNQRNRMPRIKVDILTFSMSLNIEDFLDWVGKYFELMDIPKDSQVKYVAYKLRGAASSWWDNLQTGHTSNQCRVKADNVAERGEWYEDESENEECFIPPEDVLDEEEDDEHGAYSYVVRRLMLTTPEKSEVTQRHNIFRTRCRINQDVVNVIIDGESSKNIIS
ncbi:hypothetical protein Tco_1193042 [Tanacetum coccineum]